MPGVRTVGAAPQAARRRATPWLLLALLGCLLLGGLIGRLTAPAGKSSARRPDSGTSSNRVVNGIPIGFAHTPAGAVAALNAYNAVLASAATLVNARRERRILRQVATPAYAASFGGPAIAENTAARASAPRVFFVAPIAYRIASYDAGTAVVSGYGVSMSGTDKRPPRAAWGRSVTTAIWSGDRWRISASTTTPGPSPALATGEEPSSTADFVSALRGTHGLRHEP
jgi:hypothetical protein